MSQGRSILVAILLAVVAAIAAGSDEKALRWRQHHHGRGRHHLPTPSPPAPATPTPFVPVPTTPATPAPPAPTPAPPAPTPEPCNCCNMCSIVPGPYLAAPGGVSSFVAPTLPTPTPTPPPPPPPPSPSPPPVVNCVTALAGLAPCSTFLTGRVGPPPTPQCSCCSGLSAFLASARAAGPVAGAQRLRCLCPIIHGDVNALLPRPVDTVRMMYLPVACGLQLPPETFTICFGPHMLPTNANLTSGMQQQQQQLTHP